MATVVARAGKNGKVTYTAQIRVKKNGRVVYSEAQTFNSEHRARTWAEDREIDLRSKPVVMGGAIARRTTTTLGKLIDKYIVEFEEIGKWGRTKRADLIKLKTYDIASLAPNELTCDVLVDHVRRRRASGIGPATALNDLVWVGVVLRTAKGAWRIDCDPDEVSRARELCTTLRLVGKAKKRDRLPTYGELEALDEYFARNDARRNTTIPMRLIMWFAIYTARRQEEITQLLWSDEQPERRMGLVRDAKHPTNKDGNHRRFKYTDEARAIVAMRPRDDDEDRIFPYDPKSVGARFTRACHILGIEDLHFHDLRHEGTTRLFERGLSIQEVAMYTLHESWAVLKRYTHLNDRDVVYDAPFLQIAKKRLQKAA
jgi:integrase